MTDLKGINAEFFKPYITLIKYFRWTGIDIFDEKNAFLYKFKCTPAVMLLCYVVSISSHWRYVITEMYNDTDLLELAVDISFCYNTIECCLIYLHVIVTKSRIKNYVMKLEKLWRDDDSLSPSAVLLKRVHVKQIDVYNYVYCKLYEIFCHSYLGLPLIIIIIKKIVLRCDVALTPPLKFTHPFDYQNNIVIFVIVYLFDYFTLCSMAYVLNCSLFLLPVTMNQLRVLFVLLQEDFKEVIKSEDTDTDAKLKETIQRHLILSEMLTELGGAFGAIFAIHVFFLSINICFYGIAATINGRLEDFKNFLISVLTTNNIYHCCRHGQLATDSALDIAMAIYDSAWEDLSCRNKKIILLTMLRSQRATYIRSTSFAEISLNTFKTIMNTTWSFVSLITKLYED